MNHTTHPLLNIAGCKLMDTMYVPTVRTGYIEQSNWDSSAALWRFVRKRVLDNGAQSCYNGGNRREQLHS